MQRIAPFGIIFAFTALAACSSGPKPLYYWGDYEEQLYHHLNNTSSPDQQCALLEKDAQKAQALGQHLPPGFYAHLGLLYVETGQRDKAEDAFNTEKTLFPEAAPYMDFLLHKENIQAKQSS